MIPNIVGKNGNLGTRFPPFFGQIRKNTGEKDAATNADAAVANAAACASAADTNADADLPDGCQNYWSHHH